MRLQIALIILSYAFISCGHEKSNSVAIIPIHPEESACQNHLKNKSILSHEKIKTIKRIIMVVLENTDYEASLSQPYFKKLIKIGSSFSNFFAIFRPSQPNYFAMIAGSNFNHYSNDPITLDELNLADLIEARGKTWGVFAEDYPEKCFTGQSHNHYVRRHNPFISFKNINKNPDRCKNITSAKHFFEKWSTNSLPNYSFYVPNNLNNGHDTGVDFSARWFEENFDHFLRDSGLMKNTLFILTFDEGKNSNKILTVFLGPAIRQNLKVTSCYDHYSVLRTIEEVWSLGTLGTNDVTARPITEVWKKN